MITKIDDFYVLQVKAILQGCLCIFTNYFTVGFSDPQKNESALKHILFWKNLHCGFQFVFFNFLSSLTIFLSPLRAMSSYVHHPDKLCVVVQHRLSFRHPPKLFTCFPLQQLSRGGGTKTKIHKD